MEETKPVGQNQSQIAGAIIIAGIIIAGAVMLKGSSAPVANNNAQVAGDGATDINLAKVGLEDQVLGDANAKITLVVYEDFQCPFCERFFKETEQQVRDNYIDNSNIQLVYRDFAFLGPESIKAAEAARCAGDQGKFWEYHDYLYNHQNGENRGAFSDPNLKSFAKILGLNESTFNQCLDSGKYTKAVNDSADVGKAAGVTGTPKGFLITKKDISEKTQTEIAKIANEPNRQPTVSFYKTKNIISLNGALPWSTVKQVIDILLK